MVNLAERIKKRHTSLLSKPGTTAGFSFSVFLERNRSLISQKVKNITLLLPEQRRIQPFSLTLFPVSISQDRMPSTWEPLDYIYASLNFQAFKDDILPAKDISPNIGSTSFIQSILAEKNVPVKLPSEPKVKLQAPIHSIENHPPFKGKLSEINSNPQPPTLRKTPGTTPPIHQDKRPEPSTGVTRKTLPGITFQKSYPQADIPKGSIESSNSIGEPLKNIEPLTILKQPQMQETLNYIDKASLDSFSKQPVKSDLVKEKAANINLSRQLPSSDIPVSKPVKELRLVSKKQKDKPLSLHRKIKQKDKSPGIASYPKQKKIEMKTNVEFSNPAIVQKHYERRLMPPPPIKMKEEFTHYHIPEIEQEGNDSLVEDIITNQPDRSLSAVPGTTEVKNPSDVPGDRPADARILPLPLAIDESRRITRTAKQNNAAYLKSNVNPLMPLKKYSSAPVLALKIDRKPAILSNNSISLINKNSISQKTITSRFETTDKIKANIPGLTVFPKTGPEIPLQGILRLSQETPNLNPESANSIDALSVYPEFSEKRLSQNSLSRYPEKELAFKPSLKSNKLTNNQVQQKPSSGPVPDGDFINYYEPEISDIDEEMKYTDKNNFSKVKISPENPAGSGSTHKTNSIQGLSGSRAEIKLPEGEEVPDIIKIWSQKEANRVSTNSDKPEPLVEPTGLRKPGAGNKIQPKTENQSFVQPSQTGSIENNQTGGATQSSEEVEQDIDELARKVYGIIKKRLARDRERLMGLN